MSELEKQLNRACRIVFGTDNNRSPEQQLVWEKLFQAKIEGPVFSIQEGGGYDTTEAMLTDGARRFAIRVKERIGEKETKPETKVIK